MRGNKDVNHPLNRFAHDLNACFVPVIRHAVHIDLPRAGVRKIGFVTEPVAPGPGP